MAFQGPSMKETLVPILPEQSSVDVGSMQVLRLRADCELPKAVDCSMAKADCYYIDVQLADVQSRSLWMGSELIFQGSSSAGDLSIFNGKAVWSLEQSAPFEMVRFVMPITEVTRFAVEQGRPWFDGLDCKIGTIDNVVKGLASAMVPLISAPVHGSTLLLEQIILALLTHLMEEYGGLYFPSRGPGRLAAWQERRAINFLTAHFNVPFSINELASECELSRSPFVKAFTATFGKTPHRWQIEFRVYRAKELLRGTSTIGEIAHICGFSDQSHFTRTFTSLAGVTPTNWRKHHRARV